MARFRADEADNYGGQGGSGFFSISEDKGVKRVRIMYNGIDDVEGLSVHKVKIDGKDRYVNCLREYSDPVDACPLCRDKYAVQARLFIPLYNVDEDQVQIWDRGKTMFQKISSLCSRYAHDCNLVNNVFEIERNGKPKDTNTTYEIYNISNDDTELEDLPEIPDVVGKLVLDKTADDMEYFLEQGDFPPADDEEDEAPARRRPERTERTERTRERSSSTARRTPATSGRRRSESF